MTEINKFTMEVWGLAIMTKRSHILYPAERLYLWVCQSLMFIYCPDLLYDQIKWPLLKKLLINYNQLQNDYYLFLSIFRPNKTVVSRLK